MSARTSSSDTMLALRRQYGCGPVDLTGSADALYERHLFFDNVIDPARASARERYGAFARSVRDVLSQRWVRTEQTYDRANPKRISYLWMEFLIDRSLTNNVTNLLLSPIVGNVIRRTSLDWLGLLEEEPDAGLGNGGSRPPRSRIRSRRRGTRRAAPAT
jgi:starch phosphorylase